MKERNYDLERYLNSVDGTNSYTNMIIATANQRGIKIKEDWLMKHLLGNVEDGLILYGEALEQYETYKKLLPEINKN